MKATRSLSWILFLQVISLRGVYLEASDKYCAKKNADSLTDRVHNSDVIISGTVIDDLDSSKHREKEEDLGGNSEKRAQAKSQSGSRSVAVVRVWRVIKGSLIGIENVSSVPEDLVSHMRTSDSKEDDEMNYPIIKVYGLRNDMICGSYVSTHDTRIFFLRKLRDVRDLPEKISPKMEEVTKQEKTKQKDLALVTSTLFTSTEEEQQDVSKSTSSTKKTKKRKKSKKEEGDKKKKKKKNGKRKNKKNKQISKRITLKRRKSTAKKNRIKRMSESVSAVWLDMFNNARSKRATMVVKNSSKMSPKKRSIEEETSRSVLVLNAMPARITLKNLNKVEELSKND